MKGYWSLWEAWTEPHPVRERAAFREIGITNTNVESMGESYIVASISRIGFL